MYTIKFKDKKYFTEHCPADILTIRIDGICDQNVLDVANIVLKALFDNSSKTIIEKAGQEDYDG